MSSNRTEQCPNDRRRKWVEDQESLIIGKGMIFKITREQIVCEKCKELSNDRSKQANR